MDEGRKPSVQVITVRQKSDASFSMDHHVTKNMPSRSAFTIIELLVVIAIIAVLVGIFFGLSGGVNERSRISRAQTEVALIAQYLEQYKGHFGDYPRVTFARANSSATASKLEGEDGIVDLYNALNGMRGVASDSTLLAATARQRAFIDRSKLRHEFAPSLNPPANPANPETDAVVLVDPWGNAYRYYYLRHESAIWENSSYVLYSMGGSGEHQQPNLRGFSDKNDADNLDNIYAN